MDKVQIPELPLTGGCQCGAVRYRIMSAPLTFYVCHCHDCQKQSGSAFGESLQIRVADFEVTGEVAEFGRTAGSGRKMRCFFCPACGSRLWHARAEGAEFVSLKAGTLDRTDWLKPAAHIFTSRRQPWVTWPPPPLEYEGQPDMDEMRAAWREMLV